MKNDGTPDSHEYVRHTIRRILWPWFCLFFLRFPPNMPEACAVGAGDACALLQLHERGTSDLLFHWVRHHKTTKRVHPNGRPGVSAVVYDRTTAHRCSSICLKPDQHCFVSRAVEVMRLVLRFLQRTALYCGAVARRCDLVGKCLSRHFVRDVGRVVIPGAQANGSAPVSVLEMSARFTRAVLWDRDFFFLLRTALKDRPKGPSTANKPTATNRQPPPTANCRQPPSSDQPPTANHC